MRSPRPWLKPSPTRLTSDLPSRSIIKFQEENQFLTSKKALNLKKLSEMKKETYKSDPEISSLLVSRRVKLVRWPHFRALSLTRLTNTTTGGNLREKKWSIINQNCRRSRSQTKSGAFLTELLANPKKLLALSRWARRNLHRLQTFQISTKEQSLSRLLQGRKIRL